MILARLFTLTLGQPGQTLYISNKFSKRSPNQSVFVSSSQKPVSIGFRFYNKLIGSQKQCITISAWYFAVERQEVLTGYFCLYLVYDDRISQNNKLKIYSQRFPERPDFKCQNLFKITYLTVLFHCHSLDDKIK